MKPVSVQGRDFPRSVFRQPFCLHSRDAEYIRGHRARAGSCTSCGAAFQAGPALAPAAGAGPRRQAHAPRPLARAARDGRGLALARGDRRIHRRQQPLSRAALQRVRELPAVRAALPLRRRPLEEQGRRGHRQRRRFADAHLPAPRHCGRARGGAAGRRADHARRGALRPVFLLRHRRGAAQPRGRRRPPEPRAGAGPALPLRPRLSRGLERRGRCAALHGQRRMAGRRRQRARALGCAAARSLSLARGPTPCAAHLGPLGLPDAAAGERPFRRPRRAALPPDRVLPHAGDGLSFARRSQAPHAQRLHPARARHRRGRSRCGAACPPALRGAAPGRLRASLLLRPLLGRCRRRAQHALPVQRPCADRGGRCTL